MRQIFLDTETTGFGTNDRIVEIGCVEMVDRKLTGREFHAYVNPGRPNNPEALRVHGITDEFLADKPRFTDIKVELLAFLAGAEVFAHNAAFDSRMLSYEGLHVPMTDTMAMAKGLFPKQLASLDAIAKRLGVRQRTELKHGALMDCLVLSDVYLGLTRSQDSMELVDTAYVSDTASNASDVMDSGLVIIATPEEVSAHDAIMSDLSQC